MARGRGPVPGRAVLVGKPQFLMSPTRGALRRPSALGVLPLKRLGEGREVGQARA